jgi:hypothetical protein
MKVKDAIELLKNCNPENELVVTKESKRTFGSTPSYTIKDRSFIDGFDWDNHYTFINVNYDNNERGE